MGTEVKIGMKNQEIGGQRDCKSRVKVMRTGVKDVKIGVKNQEIGVQRGRNPLSKGWKPSLPPPLPKPPPPLSPLPTPAADVTLDPSTAHPRLCLSLDRRSVRLSERRPPEPPGDLCVLGAPGFTHGRHYWEVEVGGRRGWAVGAARETPRGQPRQKGGSWAPPKREVWAVGSSGKKLAAVTPTEQTALAPSERPRRLGVYLDYERGQLCFYNAESMSHIHTFHICCRERVFPFFRVMVRGTRIKICN